MARKIIIYIASSLNNKIATKDGSVEWLESIPHKEGEDYGYQKFYETVDTTIMGYSTYAQVKGWGIEWPYKDKNNYVVTRSADRQADEFVEFVSENPVEFFKDLKHQAGKDIWLVGGGQLNTLFLKAGLVDEIILHIMPILLDGGIDMFVDNPELKALDLISSKSYDSGVMELRYKLKS